MHVAAAVIRDPQGQILIARRPLDKHQGGLWEFPGGKVEAGEAVADALRRELLEELGIVVEQARPLILIRHDYPDKQVLLDVWLVERFTGTAHGAEGQPLAWVWPEALADYRFPAANRPIVAAARLPDRYLITPEGLSPLQLMRGLERAIGEGVRLIQLRQPGMDAADYRALAQDVLALCAERAGVMLKGPLDWLDDFPAAGWHLTSNQLREMAGQVRPLPEQRWLAASCHDEQELAWAAALEVDFVTLSPLLPTASHPLAAALGWDRAAELLSRFDRPAYLLGGLGASELPMAWRIGAQGIAAIRGLWPAEPSR
ncbi:Nudix family hydrolase [Stutzerimonas azotifigens]|uniref:Nudix family hydrolase n=1 Tax=Stutzerimonas azotifigens TaxID=291995 RepID=UPI0005B911B8|nr:Nudix family hydrolase [Stutzerimonas azotifigens]